MDALIRLVHTIRPLKPVQIYGRLWHRVTRPRRARGPAVERRARDGEWIEPISVARSRLGGNRFRLLNLEHTIESAADWNRADVEPLWLYNLHYFDDLRAHDAASRRPEQRDLIARWIAQNPIGVGAGWQPYPTSLRIVNWIKWALCGAEPPDGFDASLSAQAQLLSRRLERHLLGNHLFANAKALAFAGTFFQGEAAERWLSVGTTLLERERIEQILPDGGHFERSPMYHALILEDLLDLIALSRAYPHAGAALADFAAAARNSAAQMLDWLVCMSHPDGGPAFFNDTAFGVAPQAASLADHARRLGLREPRAPVRPIVRLAQSGYARLSSGPATLLIDIGEIGPDYLPGHAHADTLSMELSLAEQRVLVNSGVSRYGRSVERLRQRGTQAHNTVCIDGENSSEVWSGFRVGRRARPFDLGLEVSDETVRLACSHDGYRRLRGRPIHRRSIELAPTGLRVEDRVSGSFREAVAAFHFHPGISVSLEADAQRGSVRLPDGSALRFEISGGRTRLEPSTWQPEFGVVQPSQVLRLHFDANSAVFTLVWKPGR